MKMKIINIWIEQSFCRKDMIILTVGELIEILKKYNLNKELLLWNEFDYFPLKKVFDSKKDNEIDDKELRLIFELD